MPFGRGGQMIAMGSVAWGWDGGVEVGSKAGGDGEFGFVCCGRDI